MGKKNLKAQLNYAVQSCFKGNGKINGGFGASKHSAEQKNGKIFSWSSYHSRVDVACLFASYVREHYPEVREARQLTQEMAESFLLSKASTCTTETLDCYRSNLSSLGDNINRTYSSAHVDLKVSKVVGTTANQETRCKAMTDTHLTALRNSYRPGSSGHTAVTLAAGFKGGEIVPTFCIGATFGCLAGGLLGLDPGVAAAMGLVGLFCCATNSPITSVILSIEMFGSGNLYGFALICVLAFVISGNWSLYSSQKIKYSKSRLTPKRHRV